MNFLKTIYLYGLQIFLAPKQTYHLIPFSTDFLRYSHISWQNSGFKFHAIFERAFVKEGYKNSFSDAGKGYRVSFRQKEQVEKPYCIT